MADESLRAVLATYGVGALILGSRPRPKGQQAKELPSIEEFLRNASLYAPLEYDGGRDGAWLQQLKFGHFHFDGHCPYCRQSTTWRSMGDTATAEGEGLRAAPPSHTWAKNAAEKLALTGGMFARHLVCQRNGHLLTYVIAQGLWAIAKIGQYPSIEDLASADLERYRGLLDKDHFKELHRAGGLYAHGVGIGSLVYLRRIFERLIEMARDRADPSRALLPDFDRMRMEEKIDALRGELPGALVRNKVAYAILSRGIHELAEEECLRFFPVIRAAIILMLEQDYEAEQKRLAEKAVEDEIAALNASLGGEG